jgi:hypothetical protein
MVEIGFQLTARDYVPAQYLDARPRRWFGWVRPTPAVQFPVVLGFGSVTLIRGGGPATLVLLMLGLGGYLAGHFLWDLPWRARRLYGRQNAISNQV